MSKRSVSANGSPIPERRPKKIGRVQRLFDVAVYVVVFCVMAVSALMGGSQDRRNGRHIRDVRSVPYVYEVHRKRKPRPTARLLLSASALTFTAMLLIGGTSWRTHLAAVRVSDGEAAAVGESSFQPVAAVGESTITSAHSIIPVSEAAGDSKVAVSVQPVGVLVPDPVPSPSPYTVFTEHDASPQSVWLPGLTLPSVVPANYGAGQFEGSTIDSIAQDTLQDAVTVSDTSPSTTIPTTTPPSTTSPRYSNPKPLNERNYPSDVTQWQPLLEAHWPTHEILTALCVLQGESQGNPRAHNTAATEAKGGSAGLFQIAVGNLSGKNRITGLENEPYRNQQEALKVLLNPAENIRLAALIWQAEGWLPAWLAQKSRCGLTE